MFIKKPPWTVSKEVHQWCREIMYRTVTGDLSGLRDQSITFYSWPMMLNDFSKSPNTKIKHNYVMKSALVVITEFLDFFIVRHDKTFIFDFIAVY